MRAELRTDALPSVVRATCFRSYLRQCIDKMVLESQPPHKIVNLLFTITS